MQIGSATPYVAPLPSSRSAGSASPANSPATPAVELFGSASVDPHSAVTPSADAARLSPADDQQDQENSTDNAAQGPGDAQRLRQEQLDISQLVGRDREVRAHEQAHSAVGGAYAGSPTYDFKRGPDGRSYAVGGEVSVDVSPVANDPEATLRKMEIVQRAALAPADPSAQDRRVASQAQAQAAVARGEIIQQGREEAAAAEEERRLRNEQSKQDEQEAAQNEAPQPGSAAPGLDLYRNLGQLQEPASAVDLLA